MLVTNDVPDRYEIIFAEYNLPHKPVRMFTYLVGTETTDLDAAKWMACENKGASLFHFFVKKFFFLLCTIFRILLPCENPCGGERAGVEVHPGDGATYGLA